MAQSLTINNRRQVAEPYHQLKKFKSKVQRKAADIGFVKKALHLEVTPTFAKVKGQFKSDKDKWKAEKSILEAHLRQHQKDMVNLLNKVKEEEGKIKIRHTPNYIKYVNRRITASLREERIQGFKTKNNKLKKLASRKPKRKKDEYNVPIINLSNVQITDDEKEVLRYGLQHSFIDRSKYIKQNLAIEIEALADTTDEYVKQEDKEEYHELLIKYTNIFSKNVLETKDFTYKTLKKLIDNPDIVILEGDKESATVIMNKVDYVTKMNQMIEKGLEDGTYVESEDTTLEDLAHFKNFLYRNFKDHPKYQKMLPKSHQPARMYGSAKTHKFESYDQITVENLKLRPIMDQSGTMVYTAAQIIADYIRPLNDSKYIIKDTLTFPNILAEMQLQEDEEDISYDVESLFTNVPVEETIEYILDEIFVHKRLKPLCKSRLIMKRFLQKLVSDSLFTVNGRLLKQVDGCSMGSPLSVDISGIFMTKLEKDVVYPEKPILFRRYVDDVFRRKKKHEQDKLLPKLNSYHPKIRFTVEKNLSKFLDTKLVLEDGQYKTSVSRNKKIPTHWSTKIPKKMKRNIVTNDLHRAKKICSDFEQELNIIREKYEKASYPQRFVESVIKSFKEKQTKPKQKDDADEEQKPFVLVRIPYCDKNEKISRTFLEKIRDLTQGKCSFNIIWQSRKIKTLFKIKDPVKHKANVIYKATSVKDPSITYIGETAQIAEQRWKQHEDPRHDSAPSKHLQEHPEDRFIWEILTTSSSNWIKRKIHEALFIAKQKPVLNIQVTHRKLIIFRNGVT